jgi:hypothetical protein
MEQGRVYKEYNLCTPWCGAHGLPRCSLLSNYFVLTWYQLKCNVSFSLRKLKAFLALIFTKLTDTQEDFLGGTSPKSQNKCGKYGWWYVFVHKQNMAFIAQIFTKFTVNHSTRVKFSYTEFCPSRKKYLKTRTKFPLHFQQSMIFTALISRTVAPARIRCVEIIYIL